MVDIKKGDEETAKVLLKRIDPHVDVEEKVASIKASVVTKVGETFLGGKYRIPIMLAFFIAFFNQLSGINFVLYYAPRIFQSAGIDQTNSLIASTPIGIVNLIFTLVGMYIIDRAGRKQLMVVGSIGYIITLLGVAWSFYSGAEGFVVVAFITAFVAAHAIGQGAVIWVFISEIFPNKVRAQGMSLGSGTHWVFAATITLITPAVLKAFSSVAIFSFFAFMMVLQLLWVVFIMPETKGVPLEELQKQLVKNGEGDKQKVSAVSDK